jgi:hypothetical protein
MTNVIACALSSRRGQQRSGLVRLERPSEPESLPIGRVPRVARLLALAHKLDQLIGPGNIPNYAGLARVGHVSRARITQIMNLLHLAPDLQEQILFLPLTRRGRDRIHLRQLQPIARAPDWRQQRLLWRKLLVPAEKGMSLGRQQFAETNPPDPGRNILEVPRLSR